MFVCIISVLRTLVQYKEVNVWRQCKLVGKFLFKADIGVYMYSAVQTKWANHDSKILKRLFCSIHGHVPSVSNCYSDVTSVHSCIMCVECKRAVDILQRSILWGRMICIWLGVIHMRRLLRALVCCVNRDRDCTDMCLFRNIYSVRQEYEWRWTRLESIYSSAGAVTDRVMTQDDFPCQLTSYSLSSLSNLCLTGKSVSCKRRSARDIAAKLSAHRITLLVEGRIGRGKGNGLG